MVQKILMIPAEEESILRNPEDDDEVSRLIGLYSVIHYFSKMFIYRSVNVTDC